MMGVKAIAMEEIYRPMSVMKYVNDQILMLGLSACVSWKVHIEALLLPRLQDNGNKQQTVETLVHKADMESLGSIYLEVV